VARQNRLSAGISVISDEEDKRRDVEVSFCGLAGLSHLARLANQ
jgi:hypothetical protein